MGKPDCDVLVIGAGVSGLTTALQLADGKRRVRLLAERESARTTSAVAGASWGPYMVKDRRVLDWSKTSRRVLQEIAAKGPETGVRMVNGLETDIAVVEPPVWAAEVEDFRMCDAADLPDGYATGWRYTIPIVDMSRYLRYLNDRLRASGVEVEIRRVRSFAEVSHEAGAVVNCTGLASRHLVPDETLFPTRGQLVVVENPGIDGFFQDNTHGESLTYFLPHGDHVVLGGCAIEHSELTEPDEETAVGIIKRCGAIEPKLLGARRVEDRVGLRPTRGSVCTELSQVDGVPLIHNYGHGGAGLTLSWGCAAEVARLIDSA